MLPQMFGPALDDERFQIPAPDRGIFIQNPADCAIAPPDLPDSLHRVRELLGVQRIDEVLDRHEYGTALVMNVRKRWRLRPMIGWRGVDAWETGEPQSRSSGGGSHQRDGGDGERGAKPKARCNPSPDHAADGHRSLKDKQVYGESARTNPSGKGSLRGCAERGVGAHPTDAAGQHQHRHGAEILK